MKREVKAGELLRWLGFLACLAVPCAVEATSLKDLKIGLHVLDFVTNMPADRSGIGILYDSRVKESAEDAQAVLDALSSPAMRLPPALKPILIEIRDLDGAAGLRAVIVAEQMHSHYDRVAEYGRTRRTLILSSDIDCARAAKCTVGIASNPRVEVVVSTRQTQASGLQFSDALSMMVTEY